MLRPYDPVTKCVLSHHFGVIASPSILSCLFSEITMHLRLWYMYMYVGRSLDHMMHCLISYPMNIFMFVVIHYCVSDMYMSVWSYQEQAMLNECMGDLVCFCIATCIYSKANYMHVSAYTISSTSGSNVLAGCKYMQTLRQSKAAVS